MNQCILIWHLKGGTALQVVMTEREAAEWVVKHAKGQLSGKITDHTNWWSIDAEQVAAVQWVRPVQQQPQQQQGPSVFDPSRIRPGSSGLN